MNATQELVKHIIEHRENYKWTAQGLGMLRAYLTSDGSVRLHIWHSSLVVPHVSAVHNHPWDFESEVVCGALGNQRYLEWDERLWYGEPYNKVNILCGVGMTPSDTLQHVVLSALPMVWYGGRSKYMQKSTEIHETFFEDGTVTLCKRAFVGDPDHADVYFRRGTQFVSAEPRDATPEEIDLVLQSALRSMY